MIGLVGIREMTHYWLNKALILLEVVWEMIHGGKSDDLVRGENGNYFLKSNPSKAFILSIQIRTITKQVHKIHYTLPKYQKN